MFNAVIDAPFGKVGIRVAGAAVREIVYLPGSVESVAPDTPLAQQHLTGSLAPLDQLSIRQDILGIKVKLAGTVVPSARAALKIRAPSRCTGRPCRRPTARRASRWGRS